MAEHKFQEGDIVSYDGHCWRVVYIERGISRVKRTKEALERYGKYGSIVRNYWPQLEEASFVQKLSDDKMKGYELLGLDISDPLAQEYIEATERFGAHRDNAWKWASKAIGLSIGDVVEWRGHKWLLEGLAPGEISCDAALINYEHLKTSVKWAPFEELKPVASGLDITEAKVMAGMNPELVGVGVRLEGYDENDDEYDKIFDDITRAGDVWEKTADNFILDHLVSIDGIYFLADGKEYSANLADAFCEYKWEEVVEEFLRARKEGKDCFIVYK